MAISLEAYLANVSDRNINAFVTDLAGKIQSKMRMVQEQAGAVFPPALSTKQADLLLENIKAKIIAAERAQGGLYAKVKQSVTAYRALAQGIMQMEQAIRRTKLQQEVLNKKIEELRLASATMDEASGGYRKIQKELSKAEAVQGQLNRAMKVYTINMQQALAIEKNFMSLVKEGRKIKTKELMEKRKAQALNEVNRALVLYRNNLKVTQAAETRFTSEADRAKETLRLKANMLKNLMSMQQKYRGALHGNTRAMQLLKKSTADMNIKLREARANFERLHTKELRQTQAGMKMAQMGITNTSQAFKVLAIRMRENISVMGLMSNALYLLESRFGMFMIVYFAVRQIRELITFSTQLESALNRLATITSDTTYSFNELKTLLKTEMLNSMRQYGAGLDETYDIMRQFLSTTLSVNEAIAGYTVALKLGIAAQQEMNMSASDFSELSKMMIGIYQNFRDTFGDVIDTEKVFLDIAQTILAVYNAQTMELNEMTGSLKRSMAFAKSAGVDYKLLISILGTLATAYHRGTQAGTEMGNLMLEMIRHRRDLEELVGISLIDEMGRLRLLEFIKAIEDMDLTGVKLIETVGRVIRRIRTLRGVAGLEYDAIIEQMERLELEYANLDDVVNRRMDSIERAHAKAGASIKSIFSSIWTITAGPVIKFFLGNINEGLENIAASLGKVESALMSLWERVKPYLEGGGITLFGGEEGRRQWRQAQEDYEAWMSAIEERMKPVLLSPEQQMILLGFPTHILPPPEDFGVSLPPTKAFTTALESLRKVVAKLRESFLSLDMKKLEDQMKRNMKVVNATARAELDYVDAVDSAKVVLDKYFADYKKLGDRRLRATEARVRHEANVEWASLQKRLRDAHETDERIAEIRVNFEKNTNAKIELARANYGYNLAKIEQQNIDQINQIAASGSQQRLVKIKQSLQLRIAALKIDNLKAIDLVNAQMDMYYQAMLSLIKYRDEQVEAGESTVEQIGLINNAIRELALTLNKLSIDAEIAGNKVEDTFMLVWAKGLQSLSGLFSKFGGDFQKKVVARMLQGAAQMVQGIHTIIKATKEANWTVAAWSSTISAIFLVIEGLISMFYRVNEESRKARLIAAEYLDVAQRSISTDFGKTQVVNNRIVINPVFNLLDPNSLTPQDQRSVALWLYAMFQELGYSMGGMKIE